LAAYEVSILRRQVIGVRVPRIESVAEQSELLKHHQQA
jgi:hypothetical protein